VTPGIGSHRSQEGVGEVRSVKDRVEVQLAESYSVIQHRLPVMRHSRCFSPASSGQMLSLLLGLKFCGAGGLMVDSTADPEEYIPDRRARFIENFKPLGRSLGSLWAGSFSVLQELVEYSVGQYGVVATIRMSFSATSPTAQGPSGSFLWQVATCQPNRTAMCACWKEMINTEEIRSRGWHELRVAVGKRGVFQVGHHRLMQKAAQRIADVLNDENADSIALACCSKARLNFGLGEMHGTRPG
jgi:hypothetical protein